MKNTPGDYSDRRYRVYFELVDVDRAAWQIIADYIGHDRANEIETRRFGYAVDVPLQAVPDIVLRFAAAHIGVYQVVRSALD
jgi:hypothetical protein